MFEEQKKPGGFPVWYEPLTAYRIPKVFNLRMDLTNEPTSSPTSTTTGA